MSAISITLSPDAPRKQFAAAVAALQAYEATIYADDPSVGREAEYAAPAFGAPMPAVVPPVPPVPEARTDVDSAGVVWDAALHAGNKAKNQDGTWRAKRNSSAPPAPPAAVAPPAPPAAVAPPAPPAAVAPPAPPAAPKDYPSLMAWLQRAIPEGLVKNTQIPLISSTATGMGLTQIGDLATRPELVATYFERLQTSLQLSNAGVTV